MAPSARCRRSVSSSFAVSLRASAMLFSHLVPALTRGSLGGLDIVTFAILRRGLLERSEYSSNS
eukprot:8477299-Pyramimonas_sp.AAC.1